MPDDIARLARYPFVGAASEAVAKAEVSAEEAARDDDIVGRAIERIESAVDTGRVGQPVDDDLTELLSYPVARVLVSVADAPGLTERYARAEADAVVRRFREDQERSDLASVTREPMTLEDLAAELGLERKFEETSDDCYVAVEVYLDATASLGDDRWRLVSRSVDKGWVRVSHDELDVILAESVADAILDNLPFSPPASVETALEPTRERVEGLVTGYGEAWDFDVDPDRGRAPPCMVALFEAGTDVGEAGEFVRKAFVDAVTPGTDVEYPPPSCAAMDDLGLCVDKDDLCERIDHPLDYYAERVEGTKGDAG